MGQQTEHVPAQCNALTRLYLLSYGSAGADLGGGGGGGGAAPGARAVHLIIYSCYVIVPCNC